MAYSGLGDEIWNEVEDVLVGNPLGGGEPNSTDQYQSTTELFADDEFFHPLVIHDDEICKWVLHYRISHMNVKLWDLLLFIPSSMFTTFLLLGLQKTLQRLRGMSNSPALSCVYILVALAAGASLARSLLNMLVQVKVPSSTSEKVLWVGLRFVYLAAELGILGISASLDFISKKGLRRVLIASIVVSLCLCGVQLYLELYKPYYGNKVISSGFDLYGHGGPQFWTLLSGLISVLYVGVVCIPFLPVKSSATATRSTLFYVYTGGLLVVHVLTCAGALLISLNRHDGLCVNDAVSYLYYAFLPVFAYVCLVRPSLKFSRPNLLFSYTSQVSNINTKRDFCMS